MKIVIVLATAALTLGAAGNGKTQQVTSATTAESKQQPGTTFGESPEAAECRDRIHLVRAERGLPLLQRDTASPDEPLFIAAVDHRLDGCGVLVMRNNTSDIRPVPRLPPPTLMPAR